MGDTDKPVSDLVEFYAPHQRLELPVASLSGATLVVELRAVDPLVVLEALGGLPGHGEPPDPTMTDLDRAKAMAGPMKAICRHGIVAPLLSFDGEGRATWESMALPNRMAIFEAVMRLSGFGEVPGAAGEFPEGATRKG